VTARQGGRGDLESAILTVRRTGIDGEAADRATGEILAVDPPRRALRPAIPVIAPGATAHAG
jgi:hypothetical protein